MAIGLSFLVSISFRFDDQGVFKSGGLWQGQIFWRSLSVRMPGSLNSFPAEERFSATIAPSDMRVTGFFSPVKWTSGFNAEYVVPLGWLGVAVIVLPASIYLIRWLRISRRYRRGLCLACGYDLRH